MLAQFFLEGKHVRLIPLEIGQAGALLKAADLGRESFSFTNVPKTLVEMDRFIEVAQQEWQRGGSVPFAIQEVKTGQIIGSTRFGNLEYWNWPVPNFLRRATTFPDAVEIGWTWLGEPFQRTGINREMKFLMLKHAFEVWNVYRVTFKTDARNGRSRRAIEKIGAKFDGILRAHMPGADGNIRDSAFYSIVNSDSSSEEHREEWKSMKRDLFFEIEKSLIH